MRYRHLFVTSLLVTLVITPTFSATSDDLVKEIGKYEAEKKMALQAYESAVAEANDRAIKAYSRLALRAARLKETEQLNAIWKEVLLLDRNHKGATAWFTEQGTLETIIADLDNPKDLLGNPLEKSVSIPNKGMGGILFIGENSSLIPDHATALNEEFKVRTTEFIIGQTVGEGTIFEEGGELNGQIVGLIGNEIHFAVRGQTKLATITAPFDRTKAWSHVAVQFDNGIMQIWLNGKLVANGDAGFTTIFRHISSGGFGKGDGLIATDWKDNCQFQLKAFRLSNIVRYSKQNPPTGRIVMDDDTVLGLTPEAIANELAIINTSGKKPTTPVMLQRIDRMPPGNFSWIASGTIGIQ